MWTSLALKAQREGVIVLGLCHIASLPMQEGVWRDLPERGRCPELKQGSPPIQLPAIVQGTQSLSLLSKSPGNDIGVKTPLLCVGMVCTGRTGVHQYAAALVVKTLEYFHTPL